MKCWLLIFFLLSGSLAHAQMMQLQCSTKAKKFDLVSMFLKSKLQSFKCQRLGKGDSRSVEVDAFTSPTTVKHAYRLTRTGESSYKSEINLKLRAKEGAAVSQGDLDQLKARIGRCLSNHNKFMKGPKGETLEIVLSDSAEVPTSLITVNDNEDHREDAESYSIKITCPQILHEVLHLHGLCDEYKEKLIVVKFDEEKGHYVHLDKGEGDKAYGCRHLGPTTSIMRNEWQAVILSQPFKKWQVTACSKESREGSTQSADCPAGTFANTYVSHTRPDGTEADVGFHEGDEVLRPPQPVGDKPAQRTSLLEPAHFSVITQPGCEENELYYKCATNAYVDDVPPRGGMGLIVTKKEVVEPDERGDSVTTLQGHQSLTGGGYGGGGGAYSPDQDGNISRMEPPGEIPELDSSNFSPSKSKCLQTPSICRHHGAWLSSDVEDVTADH